MGAKQPMQEEEFTATALRGLHRLCSASSVQFIQPQTLKDADGGVNRRMRRPIGPLTIPPTVGHLRREEMVGNGVEPVVLVLEAGQDREHHAGDARLAPPAPAVVDPPIALESS